jgi:glycerol-3-phosphate dehydrogenase (NAD(P)+)
MKVRATVVGCGGWGTALALLLAGNGHDVTLWGVEPQYVAEMRATRKNRRYLPGFDLPDELRLSADLADCVPDAELIVSATPTVFLRSVCDNMAPLLTGNQLIVNVSKGIEVGSNLLCGGVIRDVCGDAFPLVGLFGPSHAEEVARRRPTTVVAASPDMDAALRVQEAFMAPMFRVYTNDDALGAEMGAALKNVIALAAGICDGLGFGDNAKSALLTRGLAEMARLGVALGARAETFAGLTGLGDLITTCVSPFGRNRAVGERIGRGEKIDEITSGMDQVAEGVRTTVSACALAEEKDVPMPIAHSVRGVLFEGADPLAAAMGLMGRAARDEKD